MQWLITLACGVALTGCAATALAPVSTEAGSDGAPKLMNAPEVRPSVPVEALESLTSGYALLQFRLDDAGKPRAAIVVLSEPKGVFDKQSRRILSRMRYSLPPAWVASHPDRIMEVAFVYTVNQCPATDAFPGMSTIITQAWQRLPEVDKVHVACEAKSGSGTVKTQSAR